MYTDEQLDKLEQEEHSITEEAIIAMLLIISNAEKNLEKELRRFYQEFGKDGVVTYQQTRKWVSSQDHRKRNTVLYLYLSDVLSKALEDLDKQFKLLTESIVTKESKFFDVDLDHDKLLLTWGADDLNWLDRLEEDVELWDAYLTSDWKRFFLQRKHIDNVLESLHDRFDSIEKIIKNLALTESTAIGSIARRAIFKELGFSKYRFYSRPDERRCETCGSLHGLVFPISAYEVGVTASPLHPRCRCWEVPIE